jgi:hypothetical protein
MINVLSFEGGLKLAMVTLDGFSISYGLGVSNPLLSCDLGKERKERDEVGFL